MSAPPAPSAPTPHGEHGHIPVLPAEIVGFRPAVEAGVFVDCTLGAGGHAELLLDATPPTVRLIGLDADPTAIDIARGRLARFGDRLTAVHSRFGRLPAALDELGIGQVHYVIADVGLSSRQLADAGRGFSFAGGRLDMRFDPDAGGRSAADIVNRAGSDELFAIIRDLGEDPFAGRIVRRILEVRRARKLNSASELADVVRGAYPAAVRRKSRMDPATRTFQALRIAVNDELEQLDALLRVGPGRLAVGGRMAVISFHSLEDRRAKHAFREAQRTESFAVLTGKPVPAGPAEQAANPRSRSAKLRVIERVR